MTPEEAREVEPSYWDADRILDFVNENEPVDLSKLPKRTRFHFETLASLTVKGDTIRLSPIGRKRP